ncbi:MAG: hypothetical protein WC209_01115 [Ignavibacteriaceae bacterium]
MGRWDFGTMRLWEERGEFANNSTKKPCLCSAAADWWRKGFATWTQRHDEYIFFGSAVL